MENVYKKRHYGAFKTNNVVVKRFCDEGYVVKKREKMTSWS
jgi:hypothetical protein